jgi:hypothetical protein
MAEGEKVPLLSVPWIERYGELWNQNQKAIEGTRGLAESWTVEMRVTDIDGREPVQINIVADGTSDYTGPVRGEKDPMFRLSAPTETWRKVAKGEMGIKRAVTGPIKFQGSLVTALKYFSGLEAALRQFGDVPTAEWD